MSKTRDTTASLGTEIIDKIKASVIAPHLLQGQAADRIVVNEDTQIKKTLNRVISRILKFTVDKKDNDLIDDFVNVIANYLIKEAASEVCIVSDRKFFGFALTIFGKSITRVFMPVDLFLDEESLNSKLLLLLDKDENVRFKKIKSPVIPKVVPFRFNPYVFNDRTDSDEDFTPRVFSP